MDINTALEVAFTPPHMRTEITHRVLDLIIADHGPNMASRLPDIIMSKPLERAHSFLRGLGIAEVPAIITVDRVQEAMLRLADSLEFAQAGPIQTVRMLKGTMPLF